MALRRGGLGLVVLGLFPGEAHHHALSYRQAHASPWASTGLRPEGAQT
jgi:hypothetical protein